MSKKHKLDYEDEEDESFKYGKVLPYAVQSHVRNTFMFKIDEPVTEPSYYRNVVDICLQAKEEDQVHFYLNTPGGLYSGLSTVLDAIARTEAMTVGIIQGDCSSAGSIIAMHCDLVDVGPYATMLAHNVSYGSAGKDADIVAHVNHTTKQAAKLVRETYEGFMSAAEIDLLLEGKQFYFDAEEIVTRLEARDEYRDAQIEAMQEQAAVEASSPVPKPAKKTPKPKE